MVLIGISGWSVVFVRVEIYDIYRGIVVYYWVLIMGVVCVMGIFRMTI